MRQSRLRAGVAQILVAFFAGLGRGPAGHHGEADKDLDVAGTAPGAFGLSPDRTDRIPGRRLVASGDEDAFGVLASESSASRRGASLVEHRRTLYRRLRKMVALDVKKLAMMRDRP